MKTTSEYQNAIKEATDAGDVHALNRAWYDYMLYSSVKAIYGDPHEETEGDTVSE